MNNAIRRSGLLSVVILSLLAAVSIGFSRHGPDRRLGNSFRRPPVNGWTLVHLEGTPRKIGFQHGWWLADEIVDTRNVAELDLKHDTGKEWTFFRDAARSMMWPMIEKEYREELQGIADGLQVRGMKLDLWDVVALNGLLEWPYYARWYKRTDGDSSATSIPHPEHCSAFVATGSYTADRKAIIAHNNWSAYMDGSRWTIIFDIRPADGYRMIMDGLPGLISSADDFGVNSAGIMITETTITGFEGYNPRGIPEFVRARKAMQYSASIDDFSRIMVEGNNGGYANDWLVADIKTNEIASLELGLKNITLERTRDGYFVGANFPINRRLAGQETTCDIGDSGISCIARRTRWEQLMEEEKGKIGVESAKRFLADHYDAYQKKIEPNERTLCGHVDLSPRGMPDWQPPHAPAGAVQNKIADASLGGQMSFLAAAGHACGLDFKASEFLTAHPEFSWQKELLRDLPSRPWTRVSQSAGR